jgi:integrase
VVNTHRMLHRAWAEFTAWGWAKRNVVSDAHPPRVPRKGRKVWNTAQLQTFLIRAQADRFFALWVLEATSGMRRCELAGARRDQLDLDAGTLAIEATRVVVDGKVIESDGKTENAQHLVALDPFTLAALTAHAEGLDRERRDLGPDNSDHGLLFCWENGTPPTRTPSPAGSRSYPRRPGCPRSTCTTCAIATPPRAGTPRSTGRRSVSASGTPMWRSP